MRGPLCEMESVIRTPQGLNSAARSGHVRSNITCEDHVDKMNPGDGFSLSHISVIQDSLSEGSLKADVVNAHSLQSLCQRVLVTCVI
jgi:hypothetical protein